MIEGLEDLHPLLGAYGDVGNELVQLHVQAVPLGQGQNLTLPGFPVHKEALGIFVPQNDVLEHRHGLYQHEMLVHHADAQLYRLAGRVNAHLLAVQENLSLRGLVETDEDVHQRGLSRAVLSQQRQHLTPVDGQADVPIGVEAAEPLADVFHSQQFFQCPLPPSSLRWPCSFIVGTGGIRQRLCRCWKIGMYRFSTVPAVSSARPGEFPETRRTSQAAGSEFQSGFPSAVFPASSRAFRSCRA